MADENKPVGSQFLEDLYQTLAYVCRKALEEDLKFPQDDLYMFQEVFEHFEIVTDRLLAIRRLLDYYDDISAELVGFAITKNIEDFDIEFSLDNETLIPLRDKIDKQIKSNAELYNDKVVQ